MTISKMETVVNRGFRGNVSREVAKRFAETEHGKFRIIQDREYKSDFNKLIDASINGLPKEDNDDNPPK